MNIYQAAVAASKTDSKLRRSSWPPGLWVWPTDKKDCCIVGMNGKDPCPRWQPRAEDLMALDWEVVPAE